VQGGEHFQVQETRIVEGFEAIADLPGPAQPTLCVSGNDNKKKRFSYSGTRSVEILLDALRQKYN